MENMRSSGKKLLATLGVIGWVVMLVYAIWYFSTGWSEQNAIMKYCSTFNDTSLGWGQYVFGHGVLNFVAGYVAVFAALAPIVFIVAALVHKTVATAITRMIGLFWALLIAVVVGIGCLYSAIFFMEQLPLVSGLFILGIIFSVLASCSSFCIIIIVDD